MPDLEEIADYKVQAREFLDRSREDLAAGVLHQASEKGWGAASHMAKAAAAAQGWEYQTHAEFNVVLDRAGQLAGNQENRRRVRRFGAVANRLHGNYYSRKRHLNAETIRDDLGDVEELIALLTPLTEAPGNR